MNSINQAVNYYYDGFSSFMEKNNRLTEFGLYGASSALLVYAFIRKRPISRFTRASEIPNHFITERVHQNGVVKKIEPGPLLLVNHKPPLTVSFNKRNLPLKIAAVEIDGNGASWLQTVVSDKNIRFLPFNNKGNECLAKVFLVENSKPDVDLAKALVVLGFAKTVPLPQEIAIQSDKYLQNYYLQLKGIESKAKRNRRGLWRSIPENWLQHKIRTEVDKLIFFLKPNNKKIPALVR